MSRWFRFYSEAVDDPKVDRLPPHLYKTWVKLLCIACQHDGKLPSIDDLAYRLRLSAQDAQQQLDELILAGLVDIDAAGHVSPHNWAERQYASDSAAERMRRHRQAKRNGDVTRDVTVTSHVTNSDGAEPEPESETETDTTSLPSESDAARAKGRKDFKFDLKGGRAGRGSVDDLVKRAEGLGLPVDDLLRTLDRNRPEKPGGYFLGMCVKRLKERLPMVEDGVLRAALNGRPTEYTLVTSLLIAASEAA